MSALYIPCLISLLICLLFNLHYQNLMLFFSMAEDFPMPLNGMAESPVFTSSPISLCIFNLCLGIQILFCFFFFGFWLFISRFFNNLLFHKQFPKVHFLPRQVCPLLLLHFPLLPLILSFICYFLIVFSFYITFGLSFNIFFPEKVFDILALLILKA